MALEEAHLERKFGDVYRGSRSRALYLDHNSALWTTGVGSKGIEIINLKQHTAALIDHDLKVRDILALSRSHRFTTFDNWRLIQEIDDDQNVLGALFEATTE